MVALAVELFGAGLEGADHARDRLVEQQADQQGQAQQHPGPAQDALLAAVDAAVEPHLLRVFRPGDLPGIAEHHPVVGMLDLVAVDEFLPEQAELVMDAVADRGQIER